MKKTRKIGTGIYLIIDPSMDEDILFHKLEKILNKPIAAVQIWDHFPNKELPLKFIQSVTKRCHEKEVPVLINNKWEWLQATNLDGVHFDQIPQNLQSIKRSIDRTVIWGLTCNNDLSRIHWANNHQLDYISFCSVFPSVTNNSCELIRFETIREAKRITSMPLFLAGGITPENMSRLTELSFDGIAVVSGIMNAEHPAETVQSYLRQLNIHAI